MKKFLQLGLGVVTAVGGFVDIGNLVTSGITGARFGASLTWAIIIGTIGMTVYAEMAGRVSAVGGRTVFHAVRERLGVRTALVNMIASGLLNLLTLAAELGGVALVLQLVTGVNYLIWVPIVAAVMWLAIWRLPFTWLENLFGVLGLALIVFVVALFKLPTDWHGLWQQTWHPRVPNGEGHPTYFFYAVSLFGACLVPYQVVFFSSGGREEKWSPGSVTEMRMNSLIGFPLGGLLSIAIMFAAVPVLQPRGVDVAHLGQVALPVTQALGVTGLAIALLGFFAATFAAGAECALSTGYLISQYFGWPWGKMHRPAAAPQFHLVCLAAVIAATGFILTTIDPVTVTLVSVVLGAAAVPLTYFPVLIVANDRDYMGDRVNRRLSNTLGTLFLVVMLVTSLATLPLLFITKAGL
ncbi:MAG TPA: divalent metal cation transporter [Jatrophihabitans sp.]|nr:divalent metal cation transporter [Jatrophihabitans sp.]